MISSCKSCSEVLFFFFLLRNCGCGQFKFALSCFCLCGMSRFYQRKSIGWYLQGVACYSFHLVVLLMGLYLPIHVLEWNRNLSYKNWHLVLQSFSANSTETSLLSTLDHTPLVFFFFLLYISGFAPLTLHCQLLSRGPQGGHKISSKCWRLVGFIKGWSCIREGPWRRRRPFWPPMLCDSTYSGSKRRHRTTVTMIL